MNAHATDFFVGSRADLTRAQLRAGVAAGRWRRVCPDGYRFGGHEPTPLDRALGTLVVTDGVASGALAALLLALDEGRGPVVDITVDRTASSNERGRRHRLLAPERIIEVAGFRCVDGLQALVDLANRLDDDRWEIALESALRKELVSVDAMTAELPHLGRQRIRGTRRIRRVLLQRPAGAPPTESYLESVMVQIARLLPLLPPPQRQVDVFDAHGATSRGLTSRGRNSGCSSSSTGSTTRASPSTTPTARRRSWPRPAGSSGASPGRSASTTATPRPAGSTPSSVKPATDRSNARRDRNLDEFRWHLRSSRRVDVARTAAVGAT